MGAQSVQIKGAAVDSADQALVVQSAVHSKIHHGGMFSACHLAAAVADNGDVEIHMKVTNPMHLREIIGTEGTVHVFLFEGPTVSEDGTEITCYDRNRVSANPPTTEVFHTPTTSADGTELASMVLPGGSKNQATGSLSTGREEWILDAGSYMLRLTNKSGGAADIAVQLDFYEVT